MMQLNRSKKRSRLRWLSCACLLVMMLRVSAAQAGVGFFSPSGIDSELIQRTQFGLINAYSAQQVRENLLRAKGTAFKFVVDLGPVICLQQSAALLKTTWTDDTGLRRRKAFAPLAENKIRKFPDDAQLIAMTAPLLDVVAAHAANVGAVFLCDEPYLNGLSKASVEHAGGLIRKELNRRGLAHVKLGVIFASGMFDPAFAKMLNAQSLKYVKGIDDYFEKESQTPSRDFKKWVENMRANRLSTYDSAGNMFTDGGLPAGFDIFAFDFYLSTLLLDGVHDNSMSWFAARYPEFGCAQFKDQSMRQIKVQLSFFQNGPVRQGDTIRSVDKKILDDLFTCRMGALTKMLTAQLPKRGAQLMLISESSNNGVLEFDAAGNREPQQPDLLLQARVHDEVQRAIDFHARQQDTYAAGLMFFTYQDEYDKSIKLKIGGAAGMPGVLRAIYQHASTATRF